MGEAAISNTKMLANNPKDLPWYIPAMDAINNKDKYKDSKERKN